MRSILLEICCFDLESAIMAQAAGADRIELCTSPSDGGITPSYATIELARKLLHIPIHVMIRPRGGNFNYNIFEYEVMKTDIAVCKNLNIDGVVFGILNAENAIDIFSCKQLVEFAKPLKCYFHRAIDVAAEPLKSLIDIIEIGFDGILTSGGKKTAFEGIELIKRFMDIAQSKITIMPGSGVDENSIKIILKETQCIAIHSSAKKIIQDETTNMFSLPKQTIDSEKIHQMKSICNAINVI